MDGDHLNDRELKDEAAYDSLRAGQWLAGRARGGRMSRRAMLRTFGIAGLAAAAAPADAFRC